MAEEERGNRTAPPSQRRPYQQRPNHSNRGRGRQDPHVSKALHYFGVSDLREWLDKKHDQEGQPKGTGPPPDPSFNYLKDPLRENASYEDQTVRQHKANPEHGANSWSRGHTPRGSRGKGDFTKRDQRRSEAEKMSFIQNPINIKVEFSTATGERSYKLDEGTKLPDIKHIPDHKRERSFRREKNKLDEETKSADSKQLPSRQQEERRSFRNDRGKADEETNVESKRFPTWQHDRPFLKGERGKNVYERGRGRGGWGEGARDNGERGRGRGERGRGGRGRGGRGFGRGRGSGRYNANVDRKFNSFPPKNIPTTEVPTEEDWNSECIDPPSTGNNESEIMGNKENEDVEETDQHYQEEFYQEEGDEYLEASGEDYQEENHPEVESETETKVELEKNLVISSVVEKNEDIGKRTVRFKEKNVEKPDKIQEQKIVSKEADEKTKNDIEEGKTVDKKELEDLTPTENVGDEKLSSKPTEEAATEIHHGNEKQ